MRTPDKSAVGLTLESCLTCRQTAQQGSQGLGATLVEISGDMTLRLLSRSLTHSHIRWLAQPLFVAWATPSLRERTKRQRLLICTLGEEKANPRLSAPVLKKWINNEVRESALRFEPVLHVSSAHLEWSLRTREALMNYVSLGVVVLPESMMEWPPARNNCANFPLQKAIAS